MGNLLSRETLLQTEQFGDIILEFAPWLSVATILLQCSGLKQINIPKMLQAQMKNSKNNHSYTDSGATSATEAALALKGSSGTHSFCQTLTLSSLPLAGALKAFSNLGQQAACRPFQAFCAQQDHGRNFSSVLPPPPLRGFSH